MQHAACSMQHSDLDDARQPADQASHRFANAFLFFARRVGSAPPHFEQKLDFHDSNYWIGLLYRSGILLVTYLVVGTCR